MVKDTGKFIIVKFIDKFLSLYNQELKMRLKTMVQV